MLASDLTVVIMAGGRSSRMGVDKSFVPFLGQPLINHVLERTAALGAETIIITNRPEDYAHLGLPLYSDIYRDKGPLGGFHAALTYARHPYVLIVACDMPWLQRPLLEHQIGLRQTADIIVPRWNKFPEPMHAVYSQNCLPHITRNLETDLLKLVAFYGRVTTRYIEPEEIAQFDPDGRSFRNVNTPEDLVE
jgi:molybdopterin-guanine dinucleotide biosynthesis protein A